MNNNWNTLKLYDICKFKYGAGLPKRNRIKGEFPVYGSGGIVDYHNDYLIKGPGIIIGRKGTIGSVYFEKRNFFPIDTVFYIEENKKKYNIRFLYFLLGNLGLDRLNSDAAVPGLNRNVAHLQKINLPNCAIQNKIASILSAYDDLIENNNRRIKILEEMAQTIYKEWFVNFRFPGHEKVKMVDSELGKIPEGWDIKQISDIIVIKSGFAFKSDTFNIEGKYGIVTIKNVQDRLFIHKCQNFIDVIPENMSKHCLLKSGDIILSLTGNVGRVCLVFGDNYLLNQRVAKLVPKSDSDWAYIYFLYLNPDFRKTLENISIGAAQQNLSPIEMGKLKINYPEKSILSLFAKVCNPILENIVFLFRKNVLLQESRDLLLPKLISGEIDVEDLDIKTEDTE